LYVVILHLPVLPSLHAARSAVLLPAGKETSAVVSLIPLFGLVVELLALDAMLLHLCKGRTAVGAVLRMLVGIQCRTTLCCVVCTSAGSLKKRLFSLMKLFKRAQHRSGTASSVQVSLSTVGFWLDCARCAALAPGVQPWCLENQLPVSMHVFAVGAKASTV
jgi:hypothetical protein